MIFTVFLSVAWYCTRPKSWSENNIPRTLLILQRHYKAVWYRARENPWYTSFKNISKSKPFAQKSILAVLTQITFQNPRRMYLWTSLYQICCPEGTTDFICSTSPNHTNLMFLLGSFYQRHKCRSRPICILAVMIKQKFWIRCKYQPTAMFDWPGTKLNKFWVFCSGDLDDSLKQGRSAWNVSWIMGSGLIDIVSGKLPDHHRWTFLFPLFPQSFQSCVHLFSAGRPNLSN